MVVEFFTKIFSDLFGLFLGHFSLIILLLVFGIVAYEVRGSNRH